ncbi:MmcQ/YjbR family DNA-binding protein [Roseisolibacter sp. H3M3-2]|uniref:MmcQ/YjbR family DNA-binding protein n=1 Tax=Roseisolibacter sp. H3M3-2 TaxID=3031323 RepID=UPI0023DAD39D|nr:MmcQ/YjbR family DNA-binding protein [Roseisolibacter sp. H3M3-2]MDF1504347.1 MmcQ/YjbR family DNA-binding protein [Roseisolibacter sp. H3M3-2]
MSAARRPLRFEDVRALAAALPGVEEGTSYGTPALKVRKRTFARVWEDGATLVLRVPFAVRDHLLAAAPAAFFVTPHYHGHPVVLVRLDAVTADALAPLLEEGWRQVAPKALRRGREVAPPP